MSGSGKQANRFGANTGKLTSFDEA
jgi:hypothetical protein